VHCGTCGTLYVNPIPSEAALADFYRDSRSQRYWASTFFPAVAEARRQKIFRPRVERLQGLVEKPKNRIGTVVDVGAGSGIFLEECRAAGLGTAWRAVEPNGPLAAMCRGKGFETFQGFAGDAGADAAWAGQADLVASFEVIEHVARVDDYLRDMARLMLPTGILVVSGLCGSGFDIACLQAASNAVAPPHHLNFLDRNAIGPLLLRCGLELVSFLTPGQLDVDIVRNKLREVPDAVQDRFVRDLALSADDGLRAAFQRFLADYGLSSHMWLVARRARTDA
jgi:SAM-dependent methyltransferase